jgi:hypothetical protein
MTSFDWCTVCNFTRYIEGYEDEKEYLDNGWVKMEYRIIDKSGVRRTTLQWMCPVCDEKLQAEQQKRDSETKDPRATDNTPGPLGSTREP